MNGVIGDRMANRNPAKVPSKASNPAKQPGSGSLSSTPSPSPSPNPRAPVTSSVLPAPKTASSSSSNPAKSSSLSSSVPAKSTPSSSSSSAPAKTIPSSSSTASTTSSSSVSTSRPTSAVGTPGASAKLVLRVQSSKGQTRLYFRDGTATWEDLRQQIKLVLDVAPHDLLLSRTPPPRTQFVESSNPNATLESLKLVHGAMLYLVEPKGESKDSSSSTSAPKTETKKAFKLTIRCQHNEKGRCSHCDAPDETDVNKGYDPRRCNHPSGVTCLHCSEYVNTKAGPSPIWCNHPDTVFCPKCAPPITEDEKLKGAKAIRCDCGPGQKCTRCAIPPPTIKVDKIPWKRYMEERKSSCAFKANHTSCAFCDPPPIPVYTTKKVCSRGGHRPYPEGVCTDCAPPIIHIKDSQVYRHCDAISTNQAILQQFYAAWFKSGVDKNPQRAAVLFGRYIDEPEETKNPGAIRAIVHALYEPPQAYTPAGGVRFLRDVDEDKVHQIAQQCDLVPVGWVITTMERKGPKYGGDVIMASWEVQQAARFQQRYADATGRSRFVTIIMQHGETIEPRAYQVSDQCVALERDNCFQRAKDPWMMAAREVPEGEISPSFVYKNKPILPGAEFLPDEFVVKVILSTSAYSPIFEHCTFPSHGETNHMRSHMASYTREEYVKKLSDFNCLVWLSKNIGIPLTLELCTFVKDRRSLDAQTRDALDRALLGHNLFG